MAAQASLAPSILGSWPYALAGLGVVVLAFSLEGAGRDGGHCRHLPLSPDLE